MVPIQNSKKSRKKYRHFVHYDAVGRTYDMKAHFAIYCSPLIQVYGQRICIIRFLFSVLALNKAEQSKYIMKGKYFQFLSDNYSNFNSINIKNHTNYNFRIL